MFKPPASLVKRIAPTEKCRPISFPCGQDDGTWLRGVVHDPTARRMNNVAGHAGLFTTAADLARFARMLINGGQLEGVRILAPLTVARMTSPSTRARREERSRSGVGHQLQLLGQQGRPAADALLRPHGLHGHLPVDRSGHEDVHRLPLQSRPPGRQGRRDRAARARGQCRRWSDSHRTDAARGHARLRAGAAVWCGGRARGRRSAR